MTDEQQADTAPAQADTAPVGDANTQTNDTQATETENTGARKPLADSNDEASTPEFSIPDEHKDKPWAAKVKSQDDIYKQLDNLTTLAGKKTIQPIDYESATPEEIADYHKSLAPEDVSAYQWGEESMPEITGPMGEVFQEAGINPYQQKVIAEKFDGLMEKLAADRMGADTSEEAYLAMMKESFGDDYEKSVGVVENALKKFASDDDKQVFDAVENKTRAAVDRTVHATVKFYEERIAKILEEHGIEESGAQAEGGEGQNTAEQISETRSRLRKEIYALEGKPHSHAKIAELKAQLSKTYENK